MNASFAGDVTCGSMCLSITISGRVAFSHPVHSLLNFCHDNYGFMSNKDSQKIQTNNYYEIIAIAIELGVYWEMINNYFLFRVFIG